MALTSELLNFIDTSVYKVFGNMRGMRMLELGNQILTVSQHDPQSLSRSETTGREYYENRGFIHTCFDLNGEDNAFQIDLSKPNFDPQWMNQFDIVTNVGTLEHVEPFRAQFAGFMNVHNFIKVGGMMIHIMPDAKELKRTGQWKRHCNYYYTEEFYKNLALHNQYKIIALEIIIGHCCICFVKSKDVPFMESRKEFSRLIVKKLGGTIYRGINDRGWRQFYNYLLFHVIKDKILRFPWF